MFKLLAPVLLTVVVSTSSTWANPSTESTQNTGFEIVEFRDGAGSVRARLMPYSQLDDASRKGTMGWICSTPENQFWFWLPSDPSDLTQYLRLGFTRCQTHREFKRTHPRDSF